MELIALLLEHASKDISKEKLNIVNPSHNFAYLQPSGMDKFVKQNTINVLIKLFTMEVLVCHMSPARMVKFGVLLICIVYAHKELKIMEMYV